MIKDWGDVLGCPYCHSALEFKDNGQIFCLGCSHRFSFQNLIPMLLRQEDLDLLEEFSRNYVQARRREGWCPMTAEQALALPYGRPPGYPNLYWEVRRQSYQVLMRLLEREGPSSKAGPVADLGTGRGWLS